MTQPLPPHDHHGEPSPSQGASARMLSWGQRVFLAPLHVYRRFLSPLKPQPTCRFYPSCSQYAVQAVELHGVARGSYLALVRLLKCHPFHPGGVDLVPGTTAPQASEATTDVSADDVLADDVSTDDVSADVSAPLSALPDSQHTHLKNTHLKTSVRGATPTEES